MVISGFLYALTFLEFLLIIKNQKWKEMKRGKKKMKKKWKIIDKASNLCLCFSFSTFLFKKTFQFD